VELERQEIAGIDPLTLLLQPPLPKPAPIQPPKQPEIVKTTPELPKPTIPEKSLSEPAQPVVKKFTKMPQLLDSYFSNSSNKQIIYSDPVDDEPLEKQDQFLHSELSAVDNLTNNENTVKSEFETKKTNPENTKNPSPTEIAKSIKREIPGLNIEDVLEGEQQSMNTKASCIRDRGMCSGQLIMTNYRLIFVPNSTAVFNLWRINPDYFIIPLGHICRYFLIYFQYKSIHKIADKKIMDSYCLKIITKDLREIKYLFSTAEKGTLDGEKIYNNVNFFAFPNKADLYFAFNHKPNFSKCGTPIYQDLQEFKRMGINLESPDCQFRLFINGKDYEISPTYPKNIIIPKFISDDDIKECCKFRTKERFPALTYFSKYYGTSLWRSSQPRVFS